MPASEHVKRQVNSETSYQIIEGNTFQVTVYKSGFWKGANYQLRPRGRYIPESVEFPRVSDSHGQRLSCESSSDSDDVLDLYDNLVDKRPEQRPRTPSEELFLQEKTAFNKGEYNLKRCKAHDQPAPADKSENDDKRWSKRIVSASVD